MTEAARAWHVDDDSLRRWVDGLSSPLVAVSVEQHLLQCETCRTTVATLAPSIPLDRIWDDVLTAVEVPRPGWVERLLSRMGVSPADALVVGSAVALRAAWLVGMVAVLAFVVAAGLLAAEGGIALFLVAAPLIPVAGVAMAYGPPADPSYEAVLVAPYAMVRLILMRTVSVPATSVPMVIVAGLLLPMSPFVAVAWLLPASGFVAIVLTASNWFDPSSAALALGVGWVVAVALAGRAGDPLALLEPIAVVLYLLLLAGACFVFVYRLYGATPSWRLR